MEIKKHITVTLTVEDIETLIKKELATRNIHIDTINFVVNGYNDEDDWRGAYPLIYKLDEIICKGSEN